MRAWDLRLRLGVAGALPGPHMPHAMGALLVGDTHAGTPSIDDRAGSTIALTPAALHIGNVSGLLSGNIARQLGFCVFPWQSRFADCLVP
jgi:hypothetical protein